MINVEVRFQIFQLVAIYLTCPSKQKDRFSCAELPLGVIANTAANHASVIKK